MHIYSSNLILCLKIPDTMKTDLVQSNNPQLQNCKICDWLDVSILAKTSRWVGIPGREGMGASMRVRIVVLILTSISCPTA